MTALSLPMVDPLLLECRVYGTPAPQGSKRHVGNGIMLESSKKVGPWREAVKAAVLLTENGPPAVAEGPVTAMLVFVLDRPKSHYRTGRNAHLLRDSAPVFPAVKPDLDKLVRSTLDALRDAGVYRDDSQVVRIETSKQYASQLNGPPGAIIIVREMSR